MRKKGLTKAEKRGDRETREGLVEAYIHDGRLGAIVEVNCETSFVAKTDFGTSNRDASGFDEPTLCIGR